MSGENVNRHNPNVNFDTNEGIRRPQLTEEDVKSYALTQLGYPVTEVELTPQQMTHLMKRVLDEYNKWLPVYKYGLLTGVSSTINQYNLQSLEQPYGRAIVDVTIVSKQQFFAPIAGVFALGIPHPISSLSPDQYDLSLRYIGAAKKVYSSDMEWEWSEPILWLYAPTGYGGPFNCSYLYIQDCSSALDVQAEDWGWFKDYFLALTRMAVGESRAKFGSIPGPASQNLRGDSMIKEGLEAKKELEDSIRSKSLARCPPLFLNSKS
jgi:hypothetical protein